MSRLARRMVLATMLSVFALLGSGVPASATGGVTAGAWDACVDWGTGSSCGVQTVRGEFVHVPDGRGAVLEFECAIALTPSTGIIGITINSCYATSDAGDRVDGLNNGLPGSATATAGFSTSTDDQAIWLGCVGGEVLTVGGSRTIPERCAFINVSA